MSLYLFLPTLFLIPAPSLFICIMYIVDVSVCVFSILILILSLVYAFKLVWCWSLEFVVCERDKGKLTHSLFGAHPLTQSTVDTCVNAYVHTYASVLCVSCNKLSAQLSSAQQQ